MCATLSEPLMYWFMQIPHVGIPGRSKYRHENGEVVPTKLRESRKIFIGGNSYIPEQYSKNGCPVNLSTLFSVVNPNLTSLWQFPRVYKEQRKPRRLPTTADLSMLSVCIRREMYMHVIAILNNNHLSPLDYLHDTILRRCSVRAALMAYPSVIKQMMTSSPEYVRELIGHNYIVRHRYIFISYISDYLSKTGDICVDHCIRRQMGMKKMMNCGFSDCVIIF